MAGGGEVGRGLEGGGGGVRLGTKLFLEAVVGGAKATGIGSGRIPRPRCMGLSLMSDWGDSGEVGIFNNELASLRPLFTGLPALLAGGVGKRSTMGLMTFSKNVESYTELRLRGSPVDASSVASDAVE